MLKRVEILNPDVFGPEESASKMLEPAGVERDAYEKGLADQLKALVCSNGQSVPFIVQGLIRNHRIMDAGIQALPLVEAIFGKDCFASVALAEDTKAELKGIAIEAAAKANLQQTSRRPSRP